MEKLINSIEVNSSIIFRLPDTLDEFKGRVTEIHSVRQEALNHPQLASVYKGDLPVAPDKEGKLKMIETFYAVTIELSGNNLYQLKLGQTGDLIFWSSAKSKAVALGRKIGNLFWREANF